MQDIVFGVQAFNWNGFQDGTTFVGGLYGNLSTSVGDFATVVYRAQLLGFNAVRLPFRYALASLLKCHATAGAHAAFLILK